MQGGISMEYTIQKLDLMAGVSTRTLRYYDEVGILKPLRISSSGYRIYGKEEVSTLQQILFFKQLGVGLKEIGEIITSPEFNKLKALKEHRTKLLEQRFQISLLINNVEESINEIEGSHKMKDKDKFKGFKEKMVAVNELKYGEELREKYGDDAVKRSNKRLLNMTQVEHDTVSRLSEEIMDTLEKAFIEGDPQSELAQKTAELHKKWLCYYWDFYTKEAHAGLAQMYVDDERFTAYYDSRRPGLAVFLRDAIFHYTGNNNQ